MSISAITGKDTIHRDVSVPSLARILSTEMYQCYLKQGCFHMSISAITDKDTFHREVSVLPQAGIPSTERYQCRHRQGYHPQRCISAISSKDASIEASVLSSNHLRARVFRLRSPVLPIELYLDDTQYGAHQDYSP